jgi:hypothetical protein
MSKATKRTRYFHISLTCVLAMATAAGSAAQDNKTRSVKPEEFVKARPATAATKGGALANYKRVGEPMKEATGATRQMGITIWRLRPTVNKDGGPRILVQQGAESVAWTPEP